MTPEAQSAAQGMGNHIRAEQGTADGVLSFYRHLPLLNMRCDVDPSRAAVWWSTEHCLKLSAFAAQILAIAGLISIDDLDLHRSKEYDAFKSAPGPMGSTAASAIYSITHQVATKAQIVYKPIRRITKTTAAIPGGVMLLANTINEGFHDLSRPEDGSEAHKTKKIFSFMNGVKRARMDKLKESSNDNTPIKTKLYRGAKIDELRGGIRGLIHGTRDAVGVVTTSMWVTWRNLQRQQALDAQKICRATRIADGVSELKSSSLQERQHVIERFQELKKTEEGRRRGYIEAAQKALKEDLGAEASTSADEGSAQSGAYATPGASSSSSTNISSKSR